MYLLLVCLAIALVIVVIVPSLVAKSTWDKLIAIGGLGFCIYGIVEFARWLFSLNH